MNHVISGFKWIINGIIWILEYIIAGYPSGFNYIMDAVSRHDVLGVIGNIFLLIVITIILVIFLVIIFIFFFWPLILHYLEAHGSYPFIVALATTIIVLSGYAILPQDALNLLIVIWMVAISTLFSGKDKLEKEVKWYGIKT